MEDTTIRDPDMFVWNFAQAAEDYRMTYAFRGGHIIDYATDFDIVLRPISDGKYRAWKVLLKCIPNVHVIRDGSITRWVNHAFAQCITAAPTALEATILMFVMMYLPFEQEYAREIPNDFTCVESLDDLTRTVNDLLLRIWSLLIKIPNTNWYP